MDERFLQYIWGHALFRSPEGVTAQGKPLRIIEVGEVNRDAGPDFFNCRILFDKVLLCGQVEVDRKSSDWYRHGHHRNPAFDTVILSVVGQADRPVINSRGQPVPVLELEYDTRLEQEYLSVCEPAPMPRCYRRLAEIDPQRLYLHLGRAGVERLERKCGEISDDLCRSHNDWEAAFYRWVIRYWSGPVNADAFSELADRLPYRLILRHRDQLNRVEALLLGVSGLLPPAVAGEDPYLHMLRQEYDYLESKYALQRMDPVRWRFLRVRPPAFPTLRLALLAAFLYRSQYLFSALIEASSVGEAEQLLRVKASSFWETHYRFGSTSSCRKKEVGKGMRHSILINAVIPFLLVYGKERAEPRFCDKALRWLEALPPERNHLVSSWEKYGGIRFDSALQTQALLRLNREYCSKSRCLECRIGWELFRE